MEGRGQRERDRGEANKLNINNHQIEENVEVYCTIPTNFMQV